MVLTLFGMFHFQDKYCFAVLLSDLENYINWKWQIEKLDHDGKETILDLKRGRSGRPFLRALDPED